MSVIAAWSALAFTLVLNVYAQVILKMQLTMSGPMPVSFYGMVQYFFRLLFDVWIWTAVAAAIISSLAWVAALSVLPLGVAYPFKSLTIAAVAFSSFFFLHEHIRMNHAAGILLVCVGLLLIARA